MVRLHPRHAPNNMNQAQCCCTAQLDIGLFVHTRTVGVQGWPASGFPINNNAASQSESTTPLVGLVLDCYLMALVTIATKTTDKCHCATLWWSMRIWTKHVFEKKVATKTGDSKPSGTNGGGSAKTLGVSQQPAGNPIMDYGSFTVTSSSPSTVSPHLGMIDWM